MFSPEGYLSFESFAGFFRDWTNRAYLAHLMEEEGQDPTEVFEPNEEADRLLLSFRLEQFRKESPSGSVNREEPHWNNHLSRKKEDDFLIPLIFHCAISKAVMKFDTLLSSPDGTVMRPDDYVFIHLDRLDWTYPSWPLRKSGELLHLFDMFDEGRFHAADLAKRYCFLDFELGVLRKKNNSVSGFKTSSHFGDDEFCDRYISAQVDPFLSWALVWNADDLPSDLPQFLEDIGVLEERWGVPKLLKDNGSESRIPAKRGAKPTGAKAEFLRRYPLGKPEGLSAEAIAAELAEAGFPISGRQILNYSKEIMGE